MLRAYPEERISIRDRPASISFPLMFQGGSQNPISLGSLFWLEVTGKESVNNLRKAGKNVGADLRFVDRPRISHQDREQTVWRLLEE